MLSSVREGAALGRGARNSSRIPPNKLEHRSQYLGRVKVRKGAPKSPAAHHAGESILFQRPARFTKCLHTLYRVPSEVVNSLTMVPQKIMIDGVSLNKFR